MTFFAAGTTWSAEQAPLDKIVLLHWIGGSYGHFIYRMMHAHLEGLPDLMDSFDFHQGSSHSIRQNSYVNGIIAKCKRDSDIKIEMLRDVESSYLIIRRHSPSVVPIIPLKIIEDCKLNIKIVVENDVFFAWSTIQNIIKIEDPYLFYDKELVDMIRSNQIDPVRSRDLLSKMVQSRQRSWYHPTLKENFYNLNISDLFVNNGMKNILVDLSKRLDLKIKNASDIEGKMQKFYSTQRYIDSLRRHMLAEWNESNPMDQLLKSFHLGA